MTRIDEPSITRASTETSYWRLVERWWSLVSQCESRRILSPSTQNLVVVGSSPNRPTTSFPHVLKNACTQIERHSECLLPDLLLRGQLAPVCWRVTEHVEPSVSEHSLRRQNLKCCTGETGTTAVPCCPTKVGNSLNREAPIRPLHSLSHRGRLAFFESLPLLRRQGGQLPGGELSSLLARQGFQLRNP